MTLEELLKYIEIENIILIDIDTCEELYNDISLKCKYYLHWNVDRIEAVLEDENKPYLLIGIYYR